MDPFGSKAQGIRKQPTVVAPAGFVRPGCDASAFLQPKEADQLLAKFDSDCVRLALCLALHQSLDLLPPYSNDA